MKTQTLSETNKTLNKEFNAACDECGGWTRVGGMSQYYHTAMGCECRRNYSLIRKILNKLGITTYNK
jgi:hypothetical protein